MYNTFGIPSFIRTSRIVIIYGGVVLFQPTIHYTLNSETTDKLRALLNWVRVNLRAIIIVVGFYYNTYNNIKHKCPIV